MSSRTKRTRAAMQMAELARLAPMVVARRTARMAQPRSAAANEREARLMVTEKIGASTESMLRTAMAAMRMQTAFATFFARAWFAPGSGNVAALVASSAADLSNSAIAPYLKKVRANARRLTR